MDMGENITSLAEMIRTGQKDRLQIQNCGLQRNHFDHVNCSIIKILHIKLSCWTVHDELRDESPKK